MKPLADSISYPGVQCIVLATKFSFLFTFSRKGENVFYVLGVKVDVMFVG